MVTADDKEVRIKEFVEACNEEYAFAILKTGIADTNLKAAASPLRRRRAWGLDVHRKPARGQRQRHAHHQGFGRAQSPG
eukprot:4101630-Pleurochrysis_carterae.AAC.1